MGLLAVLVLSGCTVGPEETAQKPLSDGTEIVELKATPPERARGLLSQLGLDTASTLPEGQALALGGSPDERRKAHTILDLVDTRGEYAVETLTPVAEARSIPANDHIAELLGDISIGTFAHPPARGDKPRAIIDIHGESVVAIAPAYLQREIVALVRFGPSALQQIRGETAPQQSPAPEAPEPLPPEPVAQAVSEQNEPSPGPSIAKDTSPEVLAALILPEPSEPSVLGVQVDAPTEPAPTPPREPEPVEPTASEEIIVRPDGPDVIAGPPLATDKPRQEDVGDLTPMEAAPRREPEQVARTVPNYEPAPLANGEDVLELDLPEKLEVIQLLDLAAEYLNLDYMYDPEKIRGHSVSLRLHGKLQGTVRVRELYPLLESVLKFKGFAMTCHKDNLVTIVPVTDALEVDPALLDPVSTTLGAGDMVVTRVFDLQYVNTASAMNLLEAMKLSVAASPIEETKTLIVTCYAHRMTRIERLLDMVDRPGRPKEFRYRQLKHTMAGILAKKVEALAAELQTVPVQIAPVERSTSSPVLTANTPPRLASGFNLPPDRTDSIDSPRKGTVYLDTDERTNRILMIGHAEQLVMVESLVDALDVAQHDPRILKLYGIVHLTAVDARRKLEELDIINRSSKAAGTVPAVFASKTSSSTSVDGGSVAEQVVMEEIQVTVLEATNSLLVNASDGQHARIKTVLENIDVAPPDLRTFRVYDIRYVKADDVKKKLSELGLFGKKGSSSTAATASPSPSSLGGDSEALESSVALEAQVIVREATNSLVVNATEEQHARIEAVVELVDVVQQDLRTLKVYDIQHVDAQEVKKKLDEFELLGATHEAAIEPIAFAKPSTPSNPGTSPPAVSDTRLEASPAAQEPQVVVLESTNSLLINATDFQHVQIANVIKHVDAAVRQEAIPYEIYFLENQDPETLAEVLGKLIQKTVAGKEDKIEKAVRRREEDIVIVPDKGTFSLIVYASKRNQDWISKLITALDKRRPQVLIDVTLVEIRKTDEFNYDLNLITSIPNLADTGGQTGSFPIGEGSTVTDKLLQPGTRSQFVDLQANAGAGTGFYADLHVNALLTAMQARNYGRVLAKPKVLVNDNETGTITTADTTYVAKKSSIPVTSGASGTQSSLIETALDYEPYDAGITLGITPHISEGQLLRLEITLTRSDFTSITGDKPPDQTSSDINTVVTVPDGKTIILGGMLKLNQEKGGNKVPILGDLPLVGGVFRSVANSDIQSKLYVFVRAEIIRPTDALAETPGDLERISERNRTAFEEHEAEFQGYQNWPGIKPKPIKPRSVLEAQ